MRQRSWFPFSRGGNPGLGKQLAVQTHIDFTIIRGELGVLIDKQRTGVLLLQTKGRLIACRDCGSHSRRDRELNGPKSPCAQRGVLLVSPGKAETVLGGH